MTATAPEGFLADIETYENILWEVAPDGIATLTLNRPEKLNAFDKRMLHEIRDAIWKASFDDDVKIVIITGSGRGFCSGRDISGLRMENALSSPQYRTYVRANHETFDDLEAFEKPLIAAVNGVCAGGGVELWRPPAIFGVAAEGCVVPAARDGSWAYCRPPEPVRRLIDVMGIGRLKEMVHHR